MGWGKELTQFALEARLPQMLLAGFTCKMKEVQCGSHYDQHAPNTQAKNGNEENNTPFGALDDFQKKHLILGKAYLKTNRQDGAKISRGLSVFFFRCFAPPPAGSSAEWPAGTPPRGAAEQPKALAASQARGWLHSGLRCPEWVA